jgi:hypothetical protein
MTAQEFHERILSLLRLRPFVPFEVELTSGRKLLIDRHDAVSANAGKAGFTDAAGELHFFDYTTTRRLGTDVPTPV